MILFSDLQGCSDHCAGAVDLVEDGGFEEGEVGVHAAEHEHFDKLTGLEVTDVFRRFFFKTFLKKCINFKKKTTVVLFKTEGKYAWYCFNMLFFTYFLEL